MRKESQGKMKQLYSLYTVLAPGALFVALSVSQGTVVWAQTIPVQLWVTTSSTTGVTFGLKQQPNLRFGSDINDGVAAIDVDDTKVFQTMEGGGASFTDSAAWLVNEKLSPAVCDQVMQKLFDAKAGIGLSFLRNPMGASDLTRTEYTYDDDASDKADSSLPHFSIAHDLADILPLTKMARRLNPSLRLMMVPWSPPAWMKDNNSLVHGDILPQFYPHLTNYFLRTMESAIRTSPFVAGVAYHDNHNVFGAEAFFTERTGSIRNSTTVQHGKDMNLMIGVFRNWGRTFVKWPVAADENQGPHLGGCATCTGLITVHTHTKDTQGQVEYRIEYYTMGHYTKFVPVGASRIDSTASDNVLNAAFKNPDSSLVLIAYNNTNEPQPFKVRWHSRVFRYTLPVNTSATFRWPGAHDNAAISGYGIQ